ncbi:MAG: hypothetical protein JRI25_25615, partial [Deltaproteobacteria bacterium]|nr:hypothetical protein [Deltaproteobacteria bacterium]
ITTGDGYIEATFDNVRATRVGSTTLAVDGGDAKSFQVHATEADAANPWGLDPVVTGGRVAFNPNKAEVLFFSNPDASAADGCGTNCERVSIAFPSDFGNGDAATPTLNSALSLSSASHRDPDADAAYALDPASTSSSVTFTAFGGLNQTATGEYFAELCLVTGNSVDCGDQRTIEGTFEVTWRRDATGYPPGGSRELPLRLDTEQWYEWCASDPTCPFDTRLDGETWYVAPVEAGKLWAVSTSGDAGDTAIAVYDSDGTTELCTDDQSGVDELCEVTPSGDELWFEVTAVSGEGAHAVLGVSRTWIEVTANTEIVGEVPYWDLQWYRLVLATPSALQLEIEPSNQAYGNVNAWGHRGWWINGVGFCCGPDFTSAAFVPSADAYPELYFTVENWDDDNEDLPFTMMARTTGEGDVPTDPVEHTANDDWNHTSDVFDAGEHRYYSFVAGHTGPYAIWLEGMDWPDHRSPVQYTLFANPADPAGSEVRTTSGNATCPSEWFGDQNRYVAGCRAFLTEGTTYYAKVEEMGGNDEIGTMFRVDWNWWDAVLAPSDTFSDSLPAQQDEFWGFWATPGTGYRVIIDPGTPAFASLSLVDSDGWWQHSNGWCCGVGNTQAYFMPPGADPYFLVQIYNSDNSQVLDYELSVTATGTGAVATSPVEVRMDMGDYSVNDTLDAAGERFYTFTPLTAGTYTVEFTGMNWDQTKGRVDWNLFTNPADVTTSSGSATCPSVWVEANSRYEAICTAPLSASQPYLLRAVEKDGINNSILVFALRGPT